MAVYRESPPAWRRYLPLIIGAVVLVAALTLVLILSRLSSTPASTTDKVGDAISLIGQSADLFGIEYAKIAKGTPAAQTGAPGAIAKAQAAFTSVEADFRKLDAQSTDALAKDLKALEAALTTPSDNIDAIVADVNGRLGLLIKAHTTPQ